MKSNFTQIQLRKDIEALVDSIQGFTRTDLARLSGVDQASLSRFCAGKHGLSGAYIEKLWPYLYGNKRPKPDHDEAA